MATALEVLKVAKSFVGVKESPANSNNVSFNTHYYGRAVSGSAYPWCCTFLWDVFRIAGASTLFFGGDKTAYTPTLANYYKSKGRWHSTPKVGDIVFFKFKGSNRINHVGIVLEVISAKKIKTIEGNTSAGNDANGGQVQIRERSSYIEGYGRPAYDGSDDKYTLDEFIRDVQNAIGVKVDGDVGEKTLAALPTISKNTNKNHKVVYFVQRYLNELGYNCGTPDGDFGGATYAGVVSFQKTFLNKPDGIMTGGSSTWKKLLGVKEETKDKYTKDEFIRDIQKAIGVKVDGDVGEKTLAALPTVSKKTNKKHAVVKYLQKYLNELGYNCGTVDGDFGNKTYEAVVAYQSKYMSNPDGIISAKGKTWKKLLGVA